MKLYVTGCSHTAGTYLSLPNVKDRYAEVLRNKYGYDVHYDARPGASNERIYRRAVENLSFQMEKFGVPYDIAVFQWTTVDRFETPLYPEKGWMKDGNATRPMDWTDHRPWNAQWGERLKFDIPFRPYYKQCWFYMPNNPTIDENFEEFSILMGVQKRLEKKMFAQMMGVDALFKSMGVDRVIHLLFDPVTRPHDDALGRLWRSQCEILFEEVRGMDFVLPSYGFERCKKSNDEDGPKTYDGHFMADAHAQIANWIDKWINKEITIPIKQIDKNTPDDKTIAMFHYDPEEITND